MTEDTPAAVPDIRLGRQHKLMFSGTTPLPQSVSLATVGQHVPPAPAGYWYSRAEFKADGYGRIAWTLEAEPIEPETPAQSQPPAPPPTPVTRLSLDE